MWSSSDWLSKPTPGARRGRVAGGIAVALTCLIVSMTLTSCGSRVPDPAGDPEQIDTAVVTGEPAGHNADDIAFANSMMALHQHGIEVSELASGRTTNPNVVAFASRTAAALHADMATLTVLSVQWKENPQLRVGGDAHDTTPRDKIDDTMIGTLKVLRGNEFDALWLHSMAGLCQAAIEVANDELANGSNVDGIALARQIIDQERTDVTQLDRMLLQR